MKDILKIEIGERMSKVRDTLGFTQEQMAEHFPIGRADLSRIEKGEIFPNPVVLNILRTKFFVSLDWLIANSGKMFIPEKERILLEEKIQIENSKEIRELLNYMTKSPMVYHAILGYFLEYQTKYKDVIQEQIKKFEDSDIAEAFPFI